MEYISASKQEAGDKTSKNRYLEYLETVKSNGINYGTIITDIIDGLLKVDGIDMSYFSDEKLKFTHKPVNVEVYLNETIKKHSLNRVEVLCLISYHLAMEDYKMRGRMLKYDLMNYCLTARDISQFKFILNYLKNNSSYELKFAFKNMTEKGYEAFVKKYFDKQTCSNCEKLYYFTSFRKLSGVRIWTCNHCTKAGIKNLKDKKISEILEIGCVGKVTNKVSETEKPVVTHAMLAEIQKDITTATPMDVDDSFMEFSHNLNMYISSIDTYLKDNYTYWSDDQKQEVANKLKELNDTFTNNM